MKSDRILSALGDIDEKYIAEAAPSERAAAGSKIVKHKPLAWRFAPVAACAAVAVAAILIVGKSSYFQNVTSPVADNNTIVAQSELSEQGVGANDNSTDGLYIPGPTDAVSFTGVVEEIREGEMLVRVDEGEDVRHSSDLFWVQFDASAIPTRFNVGDRVAVLFNGNIDESYPAQISALDVVKDGEGR